MAVTMDGDFVELSDADQTTGWTGRAPISNIGIDTASEIEGTGCIDGRLQSGTGDATYNAGAAQAVDAAIADDGGAFTDETSPANSATANDMTLLPATPVSGDNYLFGASARFARISLNVGTIGVGTYTLTWEYWDGSSWTALSGVTDGTTDFKTSGLQVVSFTVPSDWQVNTINSQGPFYYIRATVDGGTVTTTPIGTQILMDLDLTNRHLYAWFRASSPVDTVANAGITMRISGTIGGATNYGQWDTGGADLGIVGSGGWINMTCDLLLPFDSQNGTPPLIGGVIDAGIGGAFLSGPGMAQPVIDRLVYGTTAIVRGGTGGDQGTWAEAATADIQFGHIKEIAGAIFINSRVRFGDSVGVTTTDFSDTDAVVLFESNMFVAGDLMGFEFAGNSTGTNNAQVGSASGSGVDKVGSSGGTWKAAGSRPFRVEAKNADMDLAGIFGVTMVGPAALFDDNVRNFKQEDNSAGTFLDFTREANEATANDASPFPAGAGANDAVYFGHNVRWYELNVNTGTAGAGTYTVTWEYWNGSSWASLTDLGDGTNAFKTTGFQTVSFTIPDDWAKTTIQTDSRYWIRARRDAGTVTTDPEITQCSIALAGDVELEVSSAEMISCVLSSMGAVRLRGGAFLKKTSIASTLATAKHAAVDLGGADPAADTFRDCTITGCARGILLKGSGDVTYNFRNIQFAGNTKDVRLDFGSGDTVTVNLLEGTKALVAGDFDNVNSSTLIINNPVTVVIEDVVANTQMAVYRVSDDLELFNEEIVPASRFWWERLETNPGYDETWDDGEDITGGNTLDEDFATGSITGSPDRWQALGLQSIITAGGLSTAFVNHFNPGFSPAEAIVYTAIDVIFDSETLSNSQQVRFFALFDDFISFNMVELFLRQDSSGDLRIRAQLFHDGTTNNFESDDIIELDKRYTVEVKWDITNSLWEWRITDYSRKSDGALVGPVTQDSGSITDGTTRNTEGVSAGGRASAVGAVTMFLDRIALDDTDWTYERATLEDVSFSFNYPGSDVPVRIELRKSQFAPKYIDKTIFGTITESGLTVDAAQQVDGTAAVP